MIRVAQRLLAGALLTLTAVLAAPAWAQEARVGDVRIWHPFATPTLPGATIGAVYIATLQNSGGRPDKLVRASTPAAASVEMHTMSVDAQGVMRMRQVGGVALAPKAAIKMHPGLGTHLMLVGLKAPLKEGTTFPLTLEFERGGKLEVKVVVQTPKADAAGDMPGMRMP